MRFLKTFIILFFAVNAAFAQEPAKQMPDFNFITTKDKSFKKADLQKDRKTLIVFFDATCPHCQRAAAFFNSHLKELKLYNVLFITMDENKSIQLFMKEYAPSVPDDGNAEVLRDTDRSFVANFFPKRFPAIYVYDKKQELELYTSDEKDLEKVLATLKNQ